jgi:translation initiation factor eIF-2B subunit beta
VKLFFHQKRWTLFFADLAVGNIVRYVLHIIKEEDISVTAVGIEGLSVTVDSDNEYDSEHDDHPTLSAAVLAAHARNALSCTFIADSLG